MEGPMMSGSERNKNPHRCQLCNWLEGILIIYFIHMRIPFGNQTGFQMSQWPIRIQLHSVHQLTSNCLLYRRVIKSQVSFCSGANIFSLMASFYPRINKTVDTDLGTKYESTKEIKALYEDDKWE